MKTGRDHPISRRKALKVIGAAGVAAGAVGAGAGSLLPKPTFAAPAVRKKVKLTYWTWADNPVHQKMSVDSVELFNKSQDFIAVELDASSAVMEVRRKVAVAFAAGSAPDVSGTVQTHVQDWYANEIMYPVDEFFKKWDGASDYFPSVVDAMRSKPGQPVLYMPNAILPYVTYYRADWFDEANLKPPVTYDEFIADAKALTKAPDRYGYALRGLDYYAVQPIEPIWGSAGVKFVDENGNVDFDSPEATAVTEKWVGMFTKDKSCQPTAVNDRYTQLFALMEKEKCAMWVYGAHAHPQLDKALGERIQVVETPRVKDKRYMLANPEGNFIVSSCPEKEAAWEFLVHMSSGEPARIFTQKRGLLPVRQSLSTEPAYQENRFFRVALDAASTWWMPPFHHQHWANYQDKIAPYWQQALREEISVQDWHDQAAKFLRGQR